MTGSEDQNAEWRPTPGTAGESPLQGIEKGLESDLGLAWHCFSGAQLRTSSTWPGGIRPLVSWHPYL